MNELRVFEAYDTLEDDFKQFISELGDDAYVNFREKSVRLGEWDIHWSHERNCKDYAAGREFNRIQCDCYVSPDVQRWLMSRLRGYAGWEPMISFWKQPHNFHW